MAQLPWPWLVLACLVVFAAGVVRGISGFGFSAVCVAALSLFVAPSQVVPPLFMLEVLASISMLRSAWRHVDWRWLGWLALGNTICAPLGVALLALVPETLMRLLIGSVLLVAALLLRGGVQVALEPTRIVRVGTGVVAGFINGVAAIGGIVIALLLSTAQVPPVTLRATMVVLLLIMDLYALGWAAVVTFGADQGPALLSVDTVWSAAWMAPAMLAGIWVGSRFFARMSAEQFRRHILDLLVLLALAGVLRAVVDLPGN